MFTLTERIFLFFIWAAIFTAFGSHVAIDHVKAKQGIKNHLLRKTVYIKR